MGEVPNPHLFIFFRHFVSVYEFLHLVLSPLPYIPYQETGRSQRDFASQRVKDLQFSDSAEMRIPVSADHSDRQFVSGSVFKRLLLRATQDVLQVQVIRQVSLEDRGLGRLESRLL